MSNSPDYVNYFKIRWAKKSTWTIEQAAYLSCGEDPDSKKYKISATASNFVSKRYYWLQNKRTKEYFSAHEVIDGVEYFNSGSLFRILEKKFTIDKDMRKTLDHMYRSPFGIAYTRFVTNAAYREAGRLVFEQYPNARIKDVAVAIEVLPGFFNNDESGHIKKLLPHQIEPLLKNLGELSQKPQSKNIPKVEIDLAKLVEKM